MTRQNTYIKNIRVIAEHSDSSGFGNLIRSLQLAAEFSRVSSTELLILTHFKQRCESLIPKEKNYKVKFFEYPTTLIESVTELDLAILDCPSFVAEEFTKQIKDKFSLSKVTALDYPIADKLFDLRISLFDHNQNTFQSKSTNHEVGIQYAIISSKVASIPKKERCPIILIRFSGTSSDLLEKTERIIQDTIQGTNFKIRVINNNSIGSGRVEFEEQTEFLNLLSECALYVGSGVTTLLEAAILETPTIFIGSNQSERRFANAVSKYYSVKSVDSSILNYSKQLTLLINKMLKSTDYKEFIPRIDVDLHGVHRVVNRVLQL